MTTPDGDPATHEFKLGLIEFEKHRVRFEFDGEVAFANAEFGDLLQWLPDAPTAAAELVHAAVAAWIADRSIARARQKDRWQRHIVLRFPVADPSSWPAEILQSTLRFLSNDAWTVEPYAAGKMPLFAVPQGTVIPDQAESCSSLLRRP